MSTSGTFSLDRMRFAHPVSWTGYFNVDLRLKDFSIFLHYIFDDTNHNSNAIFRIGISSVNNFDV